MSRSRRQVCALAAAATVAYGIGHDQVTARLCAEYFSIAHPHLFAVESPALLGLLWGVTATVPVGVLFGVVLATVSQPACETGEPLQRIASGLAKLSLAMVLGAVMAGAAGWAAVRAGWLSLPGDWSAAVPEIRHARFGAAWMAHTASYLVGLAGGAAWCRRLWKAHGRPQVIALWPRSRSEAVRVAGVVVAGAAVLWWRCRSAL